MTGSDPETLRRALWDGPLADPAAPDAALAVAVGALSHRDALARLQLLHQADLPRAQALAAARRRWAGSFDIALMAAEHDAGQLAALDRLLKDDGQRHAARARLLWRLGQKQAARESLDGLTGAPALACRVDLAMRAGDLAAARADLHALQQLIAPGRWHLLALRLLRLEEGAAALARAVRRGGLPECAEFWHGLFALLLTERDFPAARRALARLRALAGDDHAQTRHAEILLALEGEDAARAQSLLAGDGPTDTPWRWPPRRHALALRAGLLAARALERPDAALATQAVQARAASRLHARDQGLAALALTCRLASGDWDALERDCKAQPSGAASATLLRLGLPGAAREALPEASTTPARLRADLTLAQIARAEGGMAPLPPDAPTAPLAADLALERAENALASGDPETARAALMGALRRFPRRPPLWLALARAAFMAGDLAAAARAQRRARALKTTQLGAEPSLDLRDMLLEDAARAGSPARAALALRGVRGGGDGGGIPALLVHYWEGPESAPVARNLAAWTALNRWEQRVFGPEEALDWLRGQDAGLARLFKALEIPAARADLFRLAFLAREGGVWADVDEYPRAPVADWLAGADGVFAIEPGFGTVANNFIAARPGLGVVEQALGLAVAGLEGRLGSGEAPYPWWDSGPAVLTCALAGALGEGVAGGARGLRLLGPMDYASRVSTNLPLPHKRGALHWR